MTTIMIRTDKSEDSSPQFRAFADGIQGVGRTPGEALDAINAQLGSGNGTLLVVQQFEPDPLFTAAHRAGLMNRWRLARDSGACISVDERSELEALVDAEVEAAGRRADRRRA